MSAGVWVAVAAVVLALAFGLYRAATDGRFRGTRGLRGSLALAPQPPAPPPVVEARGALAPSLETPATPAPSLLADTPWQHDLGAKATLLQFSSAFCAPCRVTRRVLADVADTTDGVTHVEVDAEQHLDVVRRLGILRTPTTLILDADGVERGRAQGAARRDQVEAALAALG